MEIAVDVPEAHDHVPGGLAEISVVVSVHKQRPGRESVVPRNRGERRVVRPNEAHAVDVDLVKTGGVVVRGGDICRPVCRVPSKETLPDATSGLPAAKALLVTHRTMAKSRTEETEAKCL